MARKRKPQKIVTLHSYCTGEERMIVRAAPVYPHRDAAWIKESDGAVWLYAKRWALRLK